MRQETLHLTIIVINKMLCEVQVTKAELQLVGVTALFIASKIEEIYPPKIHELVYLTNNAYTKNEVLQLENVILIRLQFNFVVPYSCFF